MPTNAAQIDTYGSSPPQPRANQKWKAVAAISASACLICILSGLLLAPKPDERKTTSSLNANIPSSAQGTNDRAGMDPVQEYIAAIVENTASTPRPTNRIVPKPTQRPTSRPTRPKPSTRPTMRPTNRIVPKPTSRPTARPTPMPVTRPQPTPKPSFRPTPNPSSRPTPRPTPNPTPRPTPQPVTSTQKANPNCFTSELYDAIDNDIALLSSTISNSIERSHFLGGIVRLAAHDFMDYDRFSSVPYGADGCFDPNHDANMGLPQAVWCKSCLIRALHETKYPFISRADFWIASANAVVRQTSVDGVLDLRNTFRWGRKDRDSCPGSGDRVPTPRGCSDVEGAFLGRMGLEWVDAVALLGAHSIGRGDADFSGHEGTWSDNASAAMVFDKSYYKELFNNAWQPRIPRRGIQDWTLDNVDPENPRMMLNTDLCLVYDIDRADNECCTREGECGSYRGRQCPIYDENNKRREAANAVISFIGDTMDNEDNMPFYTAFADAWEKATTLGWDNQLSPLDICNGQNLFS